MNSYYLYGIEGNGSTPIGKAELILVNGATQLAAVSSYLEDYPTRIPIMAIEKELYDIGTVANGPFPWEYMHERWILIMTARGMWPLRDDSPESLREFTNIMRRLCKEFDEKTGAFAETPKVEEKVEPKKEFSAMATFRNMLKR